ncbi:RluA family pseudouridine synthase [Candidatus Daviesbacteria bacterium]|nr:RluA family pseudouridine synthase [Candidatus Daviesbacteria bacterium]
MNLRKVYEDEDLLVIDKPPGLVVEPTKTAKAPTLAEILQKSHGIDLERGGLIHRLDKDTSGVLLVAKTQKALANLQAQFKQRKTKKEYLALVHGFVDKEGQVEGNIGRNPIKREKFTVLADEGKEAVTEYEPVGNFQFSIFNFQSIFNDLNEIQMRKLERMKYNQFTLLSCRPLTGRTHQIRVHLKYINHPIVSDQIYAGRKMYRLDKRWCPRQFLHAKKIGFYHPRSGKWMELESELPYDLENALGNLKSQMSNVKTIT